MSSHFRRHFVKKSVARLLDTGCFPFEDSAWEGRAGKSNRRWNIKKLSLFKPRNIKKMKSRRRINYSRDPDMAEWKTIRWFVSISSKHDSSSKVAFPPLLFAQRARAPLSAFLCVEGKWRWLRQWSRFVINHKVSVALRCRVKFYGGAETN